MSPSVLLDTPDSRNQAIRILKKGGVVVMPTDTIYGITGSALLPDTVERIFHLRQRDLSKPVIILIADLSDLEQFSITLDNTLQEFLTSVWPGAVSVVLSTETPAFSHLHRGTHTLAFRLPDNEPLRTFLRQSGPLIAPSTNIAGQPFATTITEAQKYFKETVDLYLDGGTLISEPSTLVQWTPDGITTLRQGIVIINESTVTSRSNPITNKTVPPIIGRSYFL
jgi:L-threonylcarbamoyladenylate synthase